ncbi:glycosyltransferase family 9 protein [Rhabdobacter roseus]|uniref:Heptosyltransferase-2 n=1 Tax=Rhabdobacter roseus TaxID=1655419 RepID=A0A840U581_9BACT|nr:glycosyltransferase family 9 protein [Rhabdobacter roseus]MBB5286969.1 heptosyltransferase-2 [Rhabdobacter roseus]
MSPQRILVIQTAFIGDVILASALLEKLHAHFPQAQLDLLVRRGNEGLFAQHPYLHEVLIWEKKKRKYRSLFALLGKIRRRRYDVAINLQRFAGTGLLTALSGAPMRVGFDKNPLSFAFTHQVPHRLEAGTHEVDRNHALIQHLTDAQVPPPRLYPSPADYKRVLPYQRQPYLCIAPASVWFTKQYPAERWAQLIRQLPGTYRIYLLGSPTDHALAEQIWQGAGAGTLVENVCGQLSLLQSAALMQGAVMNYVNDSAPLHLCSAVNAPVCAVYCSTVPEFGFGPLAEQSFVVEVPEPLPCRPCGLHGHRACPEGHFRCALDIKLEQLTGVL